MPKISRDFDFVVRCFCEVLREQGEDAIAAALPLPGTEAGAAEMAVSDRLAHAYSTTFSLLNMIEENAYAQSHRQMAAARQLSESSGSWENTLRRLTAAGYSGAEIASELPTIRVEPVLTAHPTQAKRRTILEHHRELYLLLVQRENQMWTPGEQGDIRDQIKAVLERLWRSGEIQPEKPDIRSEVRNVLHYMRTVFPTVLSLLARRLREAWQDAGLDPALLDGHAPALPRLSFGSWVGGDRDGHPLVTAAITRETLSELQATALALVREHLTRLAQRLSLSGKLQRPGDDLRLRLAAMVADLGSRGEAATRRNPDEPWRQFVNAMLAMLPTEYGVAGGYGGRASSSPTLPCCTTTLRVWERDGLHAVDLLQALGRLLDDIEHRLVEGPDQFLGVDRADALDHPGGEVLLDALGRGRRRRAEEIGAIARRASGR